MSKGFKLKKICFVGDSHTQYLIDGALTINLAADAKINQFHSGYTEITHDIKRMITNTEGSIMEFSDNFLMYKNDEYEVRIVSLSGRSAWGYKYDKYKFFNEISDQDFKMFFWLGYKDTNYNVHKNRKPEDVVDLYITNILKTFNKCKEITIITPIPPFFKLNHLNNPAAYEDRKNYYDAFMKNLTLRCELENKINLVQLQSLYKNLDINYVSQEDDDHWQKENYDVIKDYFFERLKD